MPQIAEAAILKAAKAANKYSPTNCCATLHGPLCGPFSNDGKCGVGVICLLDTYSPFASPSSFIDLLVRTTGD